MPQELRVVRCFQCLKYQVDIVKKANKWACKMCGAKQSLAREYFRGTGQDCRSMVQQLSVRHLEMDQREAEVAELVLQNKIQLPQPTQLDPAMLGNGTNESTNTTSKGPSKWAAFLTKEENDDPSDALDASESLENVSCTTFDRERIGCPVKQSNAWSNYPSAQHDSSDSDAQFSLNMDDISPSDFSSSDIWKAKQKNPVFYPNRSAKRGQSNTTPFHNYGAQKSWTQAPGASSMQLPDFHRKGSSNNRSFKDRSETVPKPSTANADPPSASYKPSQKPCKRKCSEPSATAPLMNFGKRSANESTSAATISNTPSGNSKDNRSHHSSPPGNVSSKWAKFLPKDDETNENTDSNFIIF
ncbi:uncharacterized protein LOC1271539 [Anopheles gambiae]|uniref:uncharacterized protein LOC1271539 n=1 Tax=Anopheles gambiae TaxID=7165 RepID=UPI002AC929CD|nr:uncharacterized protein LOC1271539 [Anopheles gambiae]